MRTSTRPSTWVEEPPAPQLSASARRRPRGAGWAWLIGLGATAALLVLVARNTEFDLPALVAGMPRFWAIFSSLVQPDPAIMPEVLARAAETLQISLLSVAIGAALAFPISFLAARNLAHGHPLADG